MDINRSVNVADRGQAGAYPLVVIAIYEKKRDRVMRYSLRDFYSRGTDLQALLLSISAVLVLTALVIGPAMAAGGAARAASATISPLKGGQTEPGFIVTLQDTAMVTPNVAPNAGMIKSRLDNNENMLRETRAAF